MARENPGNPELFRPRPIRHAGDGGVPSLSDGRYTLTILSADVTGTNGRQWTEPAPARPAATMSSIARTLSGGPGDWTVSLLWRFRRQRRRRPTRPGPVPQHVQRQSAGNPAYTVHTWTPTAAASWTKRIWGSSGRGLMPTSSRHKRRVWPRHRQRWRRSRSMTEVPSGQGAVDHRHPSPGRLFTRRNCEPPMRHSNSITSTTRTT